MQIKFTLRSHLILVRMTIIKKSTNNKCWSGYGEKGTLLYCGWECKKVQPLWKAVRKFLKKLKIVLRSCSPTPGHIPGEKHGFKRHMHPNFTVALFPIAKIWKQLNAHWQMNGGKDVVCIYIYTHTHTHTVEYYPAIKNNEINAICSNIYGPKWTPIWT